VLFVGYNAIQKEVITSLENIYGVPHYLYIFIIAGTASTNHDWTAHVEQKLFSVQFNGCTAGCGSSVKMVNIPNGGSTQQAYWYFQPNTVGDITFYDAPFYDNPEAVAIIGGGPGGPAPSYIELSNVILPVKLSSFDVAEKGCMVSLTWQVAEETNLAYYSIE